MCYFTMNSENKYSLDVQHFYELLYYNYVCLTKLVIHILVLFYYCNTAWSSKMCSLLISLCCLAKNITQEKQIKGSVIHD